MKTVIIIDDERDARELLKQYLGAFSHFNIIGEAEDGPSAVILINSLKPDLILLDIQMPGCNGFEVLTQLQELPEIIFSTAYDQYALKAFEVHAIDYLLKPYGKKRFEKSVSRILKYQDNIIPLTEDFLQKQKSLPKRIILHKGNRKLIINTADITHATAFGDYTKVHTLQEEFLATTGISELLEKLKSELFIRIHRSHFVNLDKVQELKRIDRYFYVILTNNLKLKVSKTFLPQLKKLML